jgi:hypothetical protein
MTRVPPGNGGERNDWRRPNAPSRMGKTGWSSIRPAGSGGGDGPPESGGRTPHPTHGLSSSNGSAGSSTPRAPAEPSRIPTAASVAAAISGEERNRRVTGG